jgi:hypothetical protein
MQNKGEKWESVNQAETFDQLSEAILKLADKNGEIQGRRRLFNAIEMADYCKRFRELNDPNLLTREYGIRQQAMYINYYTR